MTIDWLPGFDRIFNEKYNGGTYLAGVPFRFVGHTTEVVPSSIGGAVSLAGRHENPPHFWAWPERDWKCQTVRADRSAFALKHPAGTPETNKMGAIQVEVIGMAANSERQPNWYWDWLGEEILRPVIRAGYRINLGHVAPTTGSDGYGEDGAVRMSRAEWRIFDGVCVHANVPDNEHWDMGKANLLRMAQAARGVEQELDATERALLNQIALQVARMNQSLVPRQPQNVMMTGPEVGKIVPAGTKGSEPAGDLWRWGVESILRIRDLPNKVVALLPAETGGGLTEAEVKAAVTSALAESGLLGLLPGQ